MMKKAYRNVLFILFLLGSMMIGSVSFAHTMPFSETTLIWDAGQGVTAEIKPGTTMGAIRSILGPDYKKEELKGDGIRMVTYDYEGIGRFWGRTGQRDTSPEEGLRLAGYEITGGSMRTPSGICIGTPYDEIAAKFGGGNKSECTEDYTYDFKGGAVEFTVSVDGDGRVSAISIRTEV